MNQLLSEEKGLLLEIAVAKRYPVVNLEMHSSKESSLRTTVLPNVHLKATGETMEVVKARGEQLKKLAEGGFIEIDFRPAVYVASDYTIYSESSIYKQLKEMAKESKKKPDFLFDIPHIKKGRAVITDKGREAVLK